MLERKAESHGYLRSLTTAWLSLYRFDKVSTRQTLSNIYRENQDCAHSNGQALIWPNLFAVLTCSNIPYLSGYKTGFFLPSIMTSNK